MESKFGAYIMHNGKSYDVNTEYLFDPKIATYVLIPKGGNLVIISPDLIKRLYVITDNDIYITCNDVDIDPFEVTQISNTLKLSIFKLMGDAFEITIKPKEDTDVKVYFITASSINIARVLRHNANKKYIPKGTKSVIVLGIGLPNDVEIISEIEPDDGYVFDIEYFKVTTPADAEANIILITSGGENVLLAENQGPNQEVIYDASDFEGVSFSQIEMIKFYVKTTSIITAEEEVTFEFAGLQEVK